jgi:hypothetical protein
MSDRPHLITKIFAGLFLAAAAFWIALTDLGIVDKWQQGQHDLWMSFNKAVDVLAAQGKLNDALNAHREGFDIAKRLVVADRSNTEWQRDIAVSYSKLASVYERQRRVAEALGELTKGRDIMAALVAGASNNGQWKDDLAWFNTQIARLRGEVQAQ